MTFDSRKKPNTPAGPAPSGTYAADKKDRKSILAKAIASLKKNKQAMNESKMAELHADIGELMDKHIKTYKTNGGAEHLASKIDHAAKKISAMHGIEHKHARGLVSSYIDSELNEASLPGALSAADYMVGAVRKNLSSNCTTCNGRKAMYVTDQGMFADNRKGAEKIECPDCNGTGDASVSESRSEYDANQLLATGAKSDKKTGKYHVKSSIGNTISSHDSESEALAAWKNLADNKGAKIIKEESTSVLPKVGDHVTTKKQGSGKVEKVVGNSVFFRHSENNKLYKGHSGLFKVTKRAE